MQSNPAMRQCVDGMLLLHIFQRKWKSPVRGVRTSPMPQSTEKNKEKEKRKICLHFNIDFHSREIQSIDVW